LNKKLLTKKQALREKNKRNWIIFNLVKDQLDNVDIAAPEHVPDEPPAPAPSAGAGFEMRLQQSVNRNQLRRKKAKDRFNRFAGTSGSGGRGL
jgi:hypothetical protein